MLLKSDRMGDEWEPSPTVYIFKNSFISRYLLLFYVFHQGEALLHISLKNKILLMRRSLGVSQVMIHNVIVFDISLSLPLILPIPWQP